LVEVIDAELQRSLDGFKLLFGRSIDHETSVAATAKSYFRNADPRITYFTVLHDHSFK
jgi:hypothetical protein